MGKKSKGADFVGKIPKGVWLLISLVVALILWTVLSIIPSTSRCFPNAIKVIGSIQTMVSRGLLFKDIGSSLISVLLGFLIGFVTAVPVAFLMAWYRPVRFIIEPWIQFTTGLRTTGCYRCWCRSYTSGHRYLAGYIPYNDSHNFPGCYQRG